MIRSESICRCCCALNTNCARTKTVKADRLGFLRGLFFLLCVLFLRVTVCCRFVDGWRWEIIVTTGLIDEENATRPKCCSQVALSNCHTHLHTHVLGNMHYTLEKHTKEKRDTAARRHFSRGEAQNDSNIVFVWDSQHFHKAEKVFGTFTPEGGCA